jgi:hypothetical protein
MRLSEALILHRTPGRFCIVVIDVIMCARASKRLYVNVCAHVMSSVMRTIARK